MGFEKILSQRINNMRVYARSVYLISNVTEIKCPINKVQDIGSKTLSD